MPDAAVEYGDGYVEDPDFVPNPTDQFGTLDTSGTAGAAHAQIEEITPVFEVAKRQNLAQAAKALDPDDDSVDASLVTLPRGQVMSVVDEEAIKKDLLAKADGAEEPVQISTFRGPAQAAAAEEGDEAAAEAQAEQNDQGAGGSEANDLTRQTNDPGDAAKAGQGDGSSDADQKKANEAAKKAQAATKKAQG